MGQNGDQEESEPLPANREVVAAVLKRTLQMLQKSPVSSFIEPRNSKHAVGKCEARHPAGFFKVKMCQ